MRTAFGGAVLIWLGIGVADAQPTARIREYQDMLIWTGDYDGMIDGTAGSGTSQAIKSFQKRLGHQPSGELTGSELALLRKTGKDNKALVGFAQVDDHVTGVSVGMPLKLVSGPIKKRWGQSWSAADDSIDVDTFRYNGETLQQVCNRITHFRGRQVSYSRTTDNWCVIGGTDSDGAAIYVRAVAQNSNEKGALPEIRGFSVRIVADAADRLASVPIAMSSSFSLTGLGPKITSPNRPPDLLKTPTAEIKTPKSFEPPEAIKCFNGLGNCAPSLSDCLKDPNKCIADLPGEKGTGVK